MRTAILRIHRAAAVVLLAAVIHAMPAHFPAARQADDPEYNFEFLWRHRT